MNLSMDAQVLLMEATCSADRAVVWLKHPRGQLITAGTRNFANLHSEPEIQQRWANAVQELLIKGCVYQPVANLSVYSLSLRGGRTGRQLILRQRKRS